MIGRFPVANFISFHQQDGRTRLHQVMDLDPIGRFSIDQLRSYIKTPLSPQLFFINEARSRIECRTPKQPYLHVFECTFGRRFFEALNNIYCGFSVAHTQLLLSCNGRLQSRLWFPRPGVLLFETDVSPQLRSIE